MITFIEEKRLFHLHNDFLSVVLSLRKDEHGHDELLMPFFGAPLEDPAVVLPLINEKDGASFDSLRQILPYACPTEGRGDFRPVMVSAVDPTGQRCTELYYASHSIRAGKPALPGLPSAYVEAEEEADTLLLCLRDPVSGMEAELSYTLYRDRPVLASSVCYTNRGSWNMTLDRAGSLCLALEGRWDMIHLEGGWAKERAVERLAPARLTRTIESARGASGHDHNPFVALARPETNEFSGNCVGVALVWSGDHEIAVNENAFGTTRLLAGLNPRTFLWHLAPGESFRTPEALCVYTENGLNAMSQALHDLIRNRVCRGFWRDRERPVLINNWEATYFKFNHEKILNIARTAADLGVELFVLDDGWFGKRDQDNCSLGDWVVDRRKLPDGLEKLVKDINDLGLMFGLWFEPEMVSPDSDLYRAHPDWCLHAENRPRSEARHQLILDLSRTDVQDYIIEAVSSVLRSAPISYVKWDMNRNFKEAGSSLLQDGREGEISTRYMLGLYRVLETVTSAFPEILFEGCSGGGGRFDAGMLYYMPQIWTSDDSDAVQRLYIQHGTSYCYPTAAMGAHVSAIPNHQVSRMTPLTMRGDVALAGNFGYELDLAAQTEEDKEIIRSQINRMKRLRGTTKNGTFTRLLSPFDGNITVWQFVDENRVILCVYRELCRPNDVMPVIRLRDIPEGLYRDEEGNTVSGLDLMHAGIRPSFIRGDFSSMIRVWEKEN